MLRPSKTLQRMYKLTVTATNQHGYHMPMNSTATFLDGSTQLKILFIYLFGGMLGMEPETLDMQGKLSISDLHHQALR